MAFQLQAPYTPSGDQPAAIEALVRGVDAGQRYQTLLGATGTGKTFSIANVIARTGRPITNAAIIMIIVFIAFGVTGPIPPTELGLTLAVAVLLDATVVRVMLVPATMALLGDKSWYAPKWLQKVLPHVNFSH